MVHFEGMRVEQGKLALVAGLQVVQVSPFGHSAEGTLVPSSSGTAELAVVVVVM